MTTDADALVARFLCHKGWPARKAAHWASCGPDPATMSTPDFGVGYGGGCSTCAYAFAEVRFTVTCRCGKVTWPDVTVELSRGYPGPVDLPTLLHDLERFAAADDATVRAGAETNLTELVEAHQARLTDDLADADAQIYDDKDRYWDAFDALTDGRDSD